MRCNRQSLTTSSYNSATNSRSRSLLSAKDNAQLPGLLKNLPAMIHFTQAASLAASLPIESMTPVVNTQSQEVQDLVKADTGAASCFER